MFGVPLLNSLGTDVMKSIREGDALTEVPAGRLAELAWAPLDELGEVFHGIGIPLSLISVFPTTAGLLRAEGDRGGCYGWGTAQPHKIRVGAVRR